MSEDVIREISQSLDFRSIHSLRKTCSYIRNCIDYIQPAANLATLQIYSQETKIYVFYIFDGNQESIEYQDATNGCLVIQDEKSKFLENSNFQQVFRQDFLMVLRFQKSTLERLGLDFGGIHEFYLEALTSRKSPLKVKEFCIFDKEILKVLPYLCPNTLEKINICKEEHVEDPSNILDFQDIEKLEQWKNVKEISIGKYVVDVNIEMFGGCSKANMTVKKVLKDDLAGLIRTLLLSPNFISHKYTYLQFTEETLFLNHMGPSDWIGNGDLDERRVRWYIWIPNTNDNFVMEVSYTNGWERKFEFTKIRKSQVHWEANIQRLKDM